MSSPTHPSSHHPEVSELSPVFAPPLCLGWVQSKFKHFQGLEQRNCDSSAHAWENVETLCVKITGPVDQWMGISAGPQDILLFMDQQTSWIF